MFIITKIIKTKYGNVITPQMKIYNNERHAIQECERMQHLMKDAKNIDYGYEPISNVKANYLIKQFHNNHNFQPTIEMILN